MEKLQKEYYDKVTYKPETWAEFEQKYGKEYYRVSDEVKIWELNIWLNDYFHICEKEGFSPVYYTLERSKYNGSKYKVLGRRHGLNYPAWVIEFANGVKMLAYAEEIIPHEMKARGCLYNK